jgi:hypothetical protein
MRTGVGSKLDAATQNAVVAFEVDDFDPTYQWGWSVVVTGVTSEITDPDEVEALRCTPLPRWAPYGNGRIVAISTELVSGRASAAPARSRRGRRSKQSAVNLSMWTTGCGLGWRRSRPLGVVPAPGPRCVIARAVGSTAPAAHRAFRLIGVHHSRTAAQVDWFEARPPCFGSAGFPARGRAVHRGRAALASSTTRRAPRRYGHRHIDRWPRRRGPLVNGSRNPRTQAQQHLRSPPGLGRTSSAGQSALVGDRRYVETTLGRTQPDPARRLQA